jgi:hypothetical protein
MMHQTPRRSQRFPVAGLAALFVPLIGLGLIPWKLVAAQTPKPSHASTRPNKRTPGTPSKAASSAPTGLTGDSLFIVPGKSIGKMALGPNGTEVLKRFGSPDIRDAGMMQTRQVWLSKGNRNATLYIHTTANGAIDEQPENGVSIDVVRTSSSSFHTTTDIAVGSTRTQVLRSFPRARWDQELKNAVVYSDPRKGIAFEFPNDSATARCIGISIFIPGDSKIILSDDVSRLIKDYQRQPSTR